MHKVVSSIFLIIEFYKALATAQEDKNKFITLRRIGVSKGDDLRRYRKKILSN